MFRLAALFLVTALAAGLCGFGVIADLYLAPARLLFMVFLFLAGLTLILAVRDQGRYSDRELGSR